jgi:hypothetical protein
MDEYDRENEGDEVLDRSGSGDPPYANSDIQELLDIGYNLLDGFVTWDEELLHVGTRVAQQDAFNAEQLIDYLANYQHKGISEINEFDLRWFMLSHYIRKAQADPETEERLPASLKRFFRYLRTEQTELSPSWLASVLDDHAYFQQRRRAYHDLDQVDEHAWEELFSDWCRELEDDLDVRCLWLPRDLGDGMEWAPVMGWREATLQDEANREWQRERERLLAEGFDSETARNYLEASYRIWLDTPQQRLSDLSPREVIAQERAERTDTDEELP